MHTRCIQLARVMHLEKLGGIDRNVLWRLKMLQLLGLRSFSPYSTAYNKIAERSSGLIKAELLPPYQFTLHVPSFTQGHK